MMQTMTVHDNKNLEMEDYLYEKKKKFEMMKNKQKIKKAANPQNYDLKLQSRQCEKNILRNYDFKTKSKDLAPLKQKVMLKKRQSTEKNLMLNVSVVDDNYCTNTIYLQEDEFKLNEISNQEKNKNDLFKVNPSFQSTDDTLANSILSSNLNLDVDDIIFSKRESSLSFQNTASLESSLIEIVSVMPGSASSINNDGVSMSSSSQRGDLNGMVSNLTLDESVPEKLQKKKSFSSFFQKQTSFFRTSGVLKKVKSLVQNSSENELQGANSGSQVNTSKSKENVSGTTKGKGHRKSFSIASFRHRVSKSNASIDHGNENETFKKSSTHSNSVARNFMNKISSLSRIGSVKNLDNKKDFPISDNFELHDSDATLNNDKKILSIDNLFKKDDKNELASWAKNVEEQGPPKLLTNFGKSQTELNKENFDRLCSILYYEEPHKLVHYFEKAKGDENVAISLYVDDHMDKCYTNDINYITANTNLSKPSVAQQPVIIRNNRRK